MRDEAQKIWGEVNKRAEELKVRPDQLFGYTIYQMFCEALKRNNLL